MWVGERAAKKTSSDGGLSVKFLKVICKGFFAIAATFFSQLGRANLSKVI